MPKIIAATSTNTKYLTHNAPTTSSRPIIHAMQILATYMPQYHKSILPRAKIKIKIFAPTKIGLPLKSKCNSNALIFSPIGHELNELY